MSDTQEGNNIGEGLAVSVHSGISNTSNASVTFLSAMSLPIRNVTPLIGKTGQTATGKKPVTNLDLV